MEVRAEYDESTDFGTVVFSLGPDDSFSIEPAKHGAGVEIRIPVYNREAREAAGAFHQIGVLPDL
jgi:hypothetical protein